MRCGILFNGNQNFFEPYLSWILNNSRLRDDFKISGIHTNNRDFFKSNFPEYQDALLDNANSILENSDVVFSLGYWRILKKNQIEKVRMGVINFHHSYKLKYKGRHCGTWAIRNGEEYHGSTIHYIDEKVDEGKIIDTEKFKVKNHHTAEDLFFIANNIGLDLLKKNFDKIIKCENIDFVEKASDSLVYRERDISHEISTDFLLDTSSFLREVRSLTFSKKPAPYFLIDGQRVYLKHESSDSGFLGEKKREK